MTGPGESAVRRAAALVIVVMGLTTVSETGYNASNGVSDGLLTAVLLAVPLLYVIPATRPWWLRHRYPLLAVQAALTYLPFAWFGADWTPSGWLAGLVLLTVPWPTAWFAAGILGAFEAALWTGLLGQLAHGATTAGAVWAMFAFALDALVLFGLARLTDLITAVHTARDELAKAAVTAERIKAADSLRAAIGDRLAAAAGRSTAALQAITGNPSLAREHIAATAATAREALREVRDVAARYRNMPWPEAVRTEPGILPAPRHAQAVVVVPLCVIAVIYPLFVAINDLGVPGGYGIAAIALTIADTVAFMVLQLRHSWPARRLGLRGTGRPRGWPATLLLQVALVYALVPVTGFHALIMCGLLAGSMLLLVPARAGLVAFATVIVSIPVVYSLKPPAAVPPAPPLTALGLVGGLLFLTVENAMAGLLVYGLSRLAQLAVQLENLRGERARKAVAGERLRVARDTHDLLGLGLSAIAMKSDLIGKLIGRGDARAGEEIADLARICATARADLRLVAGEAQDLPFDTELATARDVLASAGIDVRLCVTADAPSEAAAVLVPVVREAVTNILKHSSASYCLLEVTDGGDGRLRLLISNDGSDGADGAPLATAERTGSGLRNLAARLDAAGGQLATAREGGTFSLSVELPLAETQPVG